MTYAIHRLVEWGGRGCLFILCTASRGQGTPWGTHSAYGFVVLTLFAVSFFKNKYD